MTIDARPQLIGTRPGSRDIPRLANRETTRLSYAQQRLWFLHQLDPLTALYNRPTLLQLTGPLDAECLRQTLQAIAGRHEILRTTFPSIDGEPSAVLHGVPDLTPIVSDLSERPPHERPAALHAAVASALAAPFDLANGPLVRVHLFRMDPDEHVLLLATHHIIFDGWSSSVFIEELAAIYRAFSIGAPSRLPDLTLQYGDFAEWQRTHDDEQTFSDDVAYWRTRLAGAPPVSPLLEHRPRQSSAAHSGGWHAVHLNPVLARDIKTVGRENGATLFMTLLAAFATLVYRYTDRTDIVCGTPVAGRRSRETERSLGLFVNLLPLRLAPSGDLPFRTLLGDTRSIVLGALAHQDLPFERLVQAINPPREIGRPPLVQILFQLRNYPRPQPAASDITIRELDWPGLPGEFDLSVEAAERDDGLTCQFRYARGALDEGTVADLAEHFTEILERIAVDADDRLDNIRPLTASDRRRISVLNATEAPYPHDRSIPDLFEAQARRSPSAPAFIADGKRLTYAELDERSNRLARRLRAVNVEPGRPIGIFLERSFDAVVALIGSLKAGAPYLPLDPAYPRARLAFVIDDARAAAIVTSTRHLAALPPSSAVTVLVDTATDDGDVVTHRVGAESTAYVIYTSGSTGQPKGVVGLQRGAINRFAWMWQAYPFDADDVCCQRTSLGFVDSVWEVFGPLLQGVPSVIVPDEVVRDPAWLVETLAAHRVTRLVVVPSLLAALLDCRSNLRDELPRLRLVISSGESLPAELARQFRTAMPHVRLLNLYGSSEASADVTCFDVTLLTDRDARVPIGRPISNMVAYVLDRQMQPVPAGARGELYVGGPGLAHGYLGCPTLTDERFVPNPFTPERAPKLLRTGDLARLGHDGNLEFLGRSDRQVKIRGCRVEPCEIEVALLRHPAVHEAVVTAVGEGESERRLRAHIVAAAHATVSSVDLDRFLRQHVPAFLVPPEFVFVEVLPRTPSGKLDVTALASCDGRARVDERASAQPDDDVEAALIELWAQILPMRPITPDRDFFELGGHSLLAARLFARIERRFGKRLPPSTLFEAPTIRHQAQLLRRPDGAGRGCSLVVVQPNGSRPPLFCMAGVGGNVLTYRDLARFLGQDQPCYALQSYGLIGPNPLCRTVEDAAARHVEEILGVQPAGVYHLCGTSFGGLVAYEIAQQLTARGRQVGLLALFDTYGPGYPKPLPGTDRVRHKLYRFARRFELHTRNLIAGTLAERAEYIRVKGAILRRRLVDRVRLNVESIRNPLPRHLRDVEAANFKARYGYQPKPYPGRVTLFRASRQPLGIYSDPTLGWNDLALEGLEIYEVPGYHGAIIHEPLVGALAEQLKRCLSREPMAALSTIDA